MPAPHLYIVARVVAKSASMTADTPYATLADWIAREHHEAGVRLIGLNGAQGSGKSTLATRLKHCLADTHGLRLAVLGLDDLYLTHSQRRQLAEDVHPLLATRGVPGTHEVALGTELLRRLRDLHSGESLSIPRFSKARDDRLPRPDWTQVDGPIDVVLFEGWCVGTPPQAATALQTALNTLEAEEDADGIWRRWVNAQLAGPYQQLFALLQRLIFLQAPDFDCVLSWRLQQEQNDNARDAAVGDGKLMDETALRRFIAHYERLTRHALAVLPETADAVVSLTPERAVRALRLEPRG